MLLSLSPDSALEGWRQSAILSGSFLFDKEFAPLYLFRESS